MKRVLLLVLLIVSLVELALERDRIYLFFMATAVAGLVRVVFSSRHAQDTLQVRALAREDEAGECTSASFFRKQSDAYTSKPTFYGGSL
jgi:hypothetical protein